MYKPPLSIAILLFTSLAVCFSNSVVQGQLVLVTDANVLAEPPEHFDPEGEGVLSHAPIGFNFTPGFRFLSNARYDVFGSDHVFFGLPPTNSVSLAGEVRIREFGFFEMHGGSIRGLTLEEDSVALIFDGNIDALNPNSGLVDIAGGTVNLGSYNPVGGRPFEPAAEAAARISPTAPLNSVIYLSGGTLSGDLSLGTDGVLDVAAGNADLSFGSIAGRIEVSGGTFSNFSVDSLSGEINILGTNLSHGEETVGVDGLIINGANADLITGNLADGTVFELNVSQIIGDGKVNLVNDNTEYQITSDDTQGTINGGSEFAGGVEVSFEEVIDSGTFTSTADVTALDQLEEVLAVTVEPNFEVANEDAVQAWDLNFDGEFANEAELIFGYDELLLDVPEDELAIYHFDEATGLWEILPILERNRERNWIRVRTTSFSPFVLGAVSAVPEPSSTSLLTGMLLTLVIRRKRR